MKITAVITEEKLIHEKINDDYKLSARLEQKNIQVIIIKFKVSQGNTDEKFK